MFDITFAKIHISIRFFLFISGLPNIVKILEKVNKPSLVDWRWQTYWNRNGLHVEVTDGWEGIGSGCQKVSCSSRHKPRPHPHGSGNAPDVLANAVQAQQAQSIQEVHNKDDAAADAAQECQFCRPDTEKGQCSAWEKLHGCSKKECV